MHLRRGLVIAPSLVLVTTAGCTVGAAPTTAPDSSGLAPSFAPTQPHERDRAGQKNEKEDGSRSADERGDRTGRGKENSPEPTRDRSPRNRQPPQKPNGARESTPPPPVTLTASVTDPQGDMHGMLQQPPAYADIVAAELSRDRDRFELRIRFADAVPARQPDEDRVLNVASFYDVDGDGSIDYEVWASLADNGWGPSYRDNRNGRAAFMDDSGVRVSVAGFELVFRFPASHVADARSAQWAVGAEWGSLEQIATGTAAYEHAPDTGAANFPQ